MAQQQSTAARDLAVGIFVVIGLLALLFLALRAGNMGGFQTGPSYQLRAKFDNIGGLKVRAPVKSAGVVIGRVVSIRLDPKTYQAEVLLSLDQAVAFPKDSSARILTSGLLGEQYIGLEAGADQQNLSDGAEIKMTQSAVVLESLISQFLYRSAEQAGASEKR
ncbi:MAG: outer membrane lipid asymmetry maintenance protein MlaD [Burkholderiaceae bacterium]